MSSPKLPTMAQLVNDLFRMYRHDDGREYTHKEVEEGITHAAGKKLIDASYISKLRTGLIKKPSILAVEALCHFFPVDVDYFFPRITALRERQSKTHIHSLPIALKAAGADPATLRSQLAAILRGLASLDEEQSEAKEE
jgi:transcriptional regulator with XRE-family HTH domain